MNFRTRAQSKHANHSDKHGRGISRYKLRSVSLVGKCHLSLHAALSDLRVPLSGLTRSSKHTWANSKMENMGTPQNGIL